jgi:hypothetical protein
VSAPELLKDALLVRIFPSPSGDGRHYDLSGASYWAPPRFSSDSGFLAHLPVMALGHTMELRIKKGLVLDGE